MYRGVISAHMHAQLLESNLRQSSKDLVNLSGQVVARAEIALAALEDEHSDVLVPPFHPPSDLPAHLDPCCVSLCVHKKLSLLFNSFLCALFA